MALSVTARHLSPFPAMTLVSEKRKTVNFIYELGNIMSKKISITLFSLMLITTLFVTSCSSGDKDSSKKSDSESTKSKNKSDDSVSSSSSNKFVREVDKVCKNWIKSNGFLRKSDFEG